MSFVTIKIKQALSDLTTALEPYGFKAEHSPAEDESVDDEIVVKALSSAASASYTETTLSVQVFTMDGAFVLNEFGYSTPGDQDSFYMATLGEYAFDDTEGLKGAVVAWVESRLEPVSQPDAPMAP
ncbi:hypothetical protein ACFOY8_12360 [Thalassospira xianhensis]|uniref:Uncharacterized protein n=1 Tax=Thalassospira xianhensis MCCC 1A02616 TaxID=1177929 RepID=A0A367UF90_9PROT|nr:hypothetical protein [Thalassospira xianhensis]RCK06343.1 hypothetical protein TH5_09080 [Thalassospira xianhensis MCCC 1A02616]